MSAIVSAFALAFSFNSDDINKCYLLVSAFPLCFPYYERYRALSFPLSHCYDLVVSAFAGVPAFGVGITQKGLDYGISVMTPWIEADVPTFSMQDFSGSEKVPVIGTNL